MQADIFLSIFLKYTQEYRRHFFLSDLLQRFMMTAVLVRTLNLIILLLRRVDSVTGSVIEPV